jgi:hypothetical protein
MRRVLLLGVLLLLLCGGELLAQNVYDFEATVLTSGRPFTLIAYRRDAYHQLFWESYRESRPHDGIVTWQENLPLYQVKVKVTCGGESITQYVNNPDLYQVNTLLFDFRLYLDPTPPITP